MVWPADSAPAGLMLLALALVSWPPARAIARSRLLRLSVPASADPGCPGRDRAARRAMLFAGLAGSAVLAMLPFLAGALAATIVSTVAYLGLRPPSWPDRSRTGRTGALPARRWSVARVGRQAAAEPSLPFAIDLLAVCLRAGMTTSAALRSVASVLPGDGHPGTVTAGKATAAARVPALPVVLARVAAATELGSEPAAAWGDWIGDQSYGRLARALVVTGESGSAVAGRLGAVAEQLRIVAGQEAMIRGQRAGVALMAPLGLCFLPAFVCLGVVPVVVGIAGRVFG